MEGCEPSAAGCPSAHVAPYTQTGPCLLGSAIFSLPLPLALYLSRARARFLSPARAHALALTHTLALPLSPALAISRSRVPSFALARALPPLQSYKHFLHPSLPVAVPPSLFPPTSLHLPPSICVPADPSRPSFLTLSCSPILFVCLSFHTHTMYC